MASIRAIYILTSDHKLLFSRKFPTIENRLQKKMSDEYIAMNYPDRLVCSEFSNQVIKEELIQEEFKCKTYKEDLEIDHEKMDELIENVDININVNNFQNYSECPIVTLNIQNTKIWPCLYIKKFKIYGVVFPNIDFEKYKSIRAKLEKEFETEKTEKNNLDNIIIKNKCDISDFETIENSNKKELENINNINEDDIIISSNNTTLLENKINLDFPSSNQGVYNTKPNEKIDIEINKDNKIFDEKQKNKKEIEDNNKLKEKDILSSKKEEEKLFKLKKLYEEQDVSIVGSITLIENLLNYIIASKSYEENKIHTLISNMVPFGNIIETNINFMLESLNFLNQRLFNSNNLFSQSEKKNQSDQEKIKIPGWVTKIPTTYSENLNITIKEELKYVKYGQNKFYNIILCDISCLAELSRNCEITLPIKETKTNFLGNLRIHPCAKLENQNILNDATRIIFIPPHDEFKMGVFEIENFEHDKLPIIANFCLKESAQNEVKLYLKVQIDENVISKFEYFYINIPLGHFGKIVDTKIMVQVGEVSLVNNKTTLHWDLQNKVFDKYIVLSGTVNYYPRAKENVNREEKKEKNIEKENNTNNKNENEYYENKSYDEKSKRNNVDCFGEKHVNLEEITKMKSRYFTRSDIMSTNCFCKIHFKLNNFSLSNIDIDKKSLLFYPKLSPKIDIRRQFFSNDYIVWNGLSFYNNEITIPEKNDISLHKINVEES